MSNFGRSVFLEELCKNHPVLKERLATSSRPKDKSLTKIAKRSYVDKKTIILTVERLFSERPELDEQEKQDLIKKALDEASSGRSWSQVVKTGANVLSSLVTFGPSQVPNEHTLAELRKEAKVQANEMDDSEFIAQLQNVAHKHPQLSELVTDTVNLAQEYLREAFDVHIQELVSIAELALLHTYKDAFQTQIDMERRDWMGNTRRRFHSDVKNAFCNDLEG